MSLDRRAFFKIAAGTGAAISLACKAGTEKSTPKSQAVLKLSCQENVAPGETLTEKLDFLEANGFVGIEPHGRGLPERVEIVQKALEGRNIKISAVCAGFQGWLIAEDPKMRELAIETTKEILIAAGELGATGMILVPAFDRQKSLPHKEARQMLVELLQELGEYAENANTRILLEPLNRKEAHFLRQLADAAAICKDVNSPGVAVMGDFWHMTWEETSDLGAIISAGDYLHHMHIASRKTRKMPGEDEGDNYVNGFCGLGMINYQDYISMECGSKGDKKVTIPAAVKLIQEQWAQADKCCSVI
ncbi:sugar phosphate isomerase/epimerase [candidate division KSB1 bacterium]|nr:sugar phosphate isomerase/epimerase [candidate division KSB1 bacterium]